MLLKIIPVIVAAAIVIGATLYIFVFKPKPQIAGLSLTNETTITNLENRIDALEEAVNTLVANSSGDSKQASKTTTTTSSDKTKDLEDRLSSLIARVNQIEAVQKNQPSSTSLTSQTQTQSTTSTSTSKAPLYIPLGVTAGSSSTEWATQGSVEIVLDPADYSGYKNMQLEVLLRVFQGNGKAYARLFNHTDGSGITASEVTTTSESYTWVTSSGFTLAGGKKTYRLQLKSLTGYEASIQYARIKVNY